MNWMRKALLMWMLLLVCTLTLAASAEGDVVVGTPQVLPAATPTPTPAAAAPKPSEAVYRYIDCRPGSSVPLYQSSTGAKTRTGFTRGTLVVVHEYANGRARVTFGGWNGWVDTNSLSTRYPGTGEAVGYKYAWNKSGSVTLYVYGFDRALAVIPNGAKVAITDMREGSYTYVMFGATNGWAKNSDLTSKLPEDVEAQQGTTYEYRKLVGDTPGQRIQLYKESSCSNNDKAGTLAEGTTVMVCRWESNVCIQYAGQEYWVKPRNLYSQLSGNAPAEETAAQGPSTLETEHRDNPAAPNNPTEEAAAGKLSGKEKKVSAAATPAPTAAPAPDAYLGDEAVTIVTLGSRSSVIATKEGVSTVPTAELTFADVDPDKAVAYIHAPRTGRCYLRAKASGEAEILQKCPAGTVVSVLKYGKSYCKISIDGAVGYVQTACLIFCDPAAEPVGTVTLSYRGKVNGRTEVPIRNSRDMSSAIVDRWVTGTVLEVISQQGVWYEVEYEGVHGFVHKNYLTVNE